MLKHVSGNGQSTPDATAILIHFLDSGNDVIRTDAIRALAGQTPDGAQDPRIRDALLKSLLDEDADVRCDAMEALIKHALPGDAEAIRNTLVGDPVREIKMAAIAALIRLGDKEAISVFISLAHSRSEDEIAWEDENEVWDDWLDVQKAVIAGLGELGAIEAMPDLLAVRHDEFGQNLDIVVFNAIAMFGTEGLSQLLEIARSEVGQPRKRALQILAKHDAVFLEDQLDFLLNDDLAEIRILALPFIDANSDTASNISLSDPDPDVRKNALIRYTVERPKLAISALSDNDETVKATALELLRLPLSEKLSVALIANIQLWLQRSGGALTTAGARILPELAGKEAIKPLLELARDTDRPLESRIAAVDALGQFDDIATAERMIDFLGNEARQVRATALKHLADFARNGEVRSQDALELAINGILLAPDKAVVSHEDLDGQPDNDITAPKSDDPLFQPKLRITEEGEVLHTDEEPADVLSSTLAVIQAAGAEATDEPEAERLAEDTPEESRSKRSIRRAVEGPDEISEDLELVALVIASNVPGTGIQSAILAALDAESENKRTYAYESLAKRIAVLPHEMDNSDLIEIILNGLQEDVLAIRGAASELAKILPVAMLVEHLEMEKLLTDDEPMVRALALRCIGEPSSLAACLSDSSPIVRKTALENLLDGNKNSKSDAIYDPILGCHRVETISDALKLSPDFRERLFFQLSNDDIELKQAHVMLQALAVS